MNKELKNKIISDFGLSSMSPEEQEDMIERVGNLLFEAVIGRSVDELDTEHLDQFEKVIEGAGGDYEKVISFLKNNVPDFKEIVSEEMNRLKKATSTIFA
jgi:hypothetical protein